MEIYSVCAPATCCNSVKLLLHLLTRHIFLVDNIFIWWKNASQNPAFIVWQTPCSGLIWWHKAEGTNFLWLWDTLGFRGSCSGWQWWLLHVSRPLSCWPGPVDGSGSDLSGPVSKKSGLLVSVTQSQSCYLLSWVVAPLSPVQCFLWPITQLCHLIAEWREQWELQQQQSVNPKQFITFALIIVWMLYIVNINPTPPLSWTNTSLKQFQQKLNSMTFMRLDLLLY